MKIAVFHNFLDNIGGAEMVSLILARELGADIYTTNIDRDKIIKMGFERILPRIFSIGNVPVNAPFRQQIALLRFRLLNLKNKYDFYIIAGDWALSGAVNNRPNLWYVHSPIREIWDLKDYTKNNLVSLWKRPLFEIWVFFNRFLNKGYIKKTGKIACNSENTRKRILKYLHKDAEVINPPVDTAKFNCHNMPAGEKDFWLSVNRLISHKRIELQLESFSKMPQEKLIIAGCYEESAHFKEYAKKCLETKPKNVEIKSWVPEEELISLYKSCKGFMATSKDEDFGLNVVEAMASGKPVIAPNEGGYKETIISGKTGILIDSINPEKIVEAVEIIGSSPGRYKNACEKQAQNFDTKIFIEKIKKIITS